MKKTLKKIPYFRKGIHYFQSLFPKHFIYTKEFYKWYNFLQESQWWSKEKLKKYQWEQLQKLLKHCYHNVPYYQNIFRELDATPEDFKNFDDFQKFPFLTKEIVREKLNEFIPNGINKSKLFYTTTGGSTGEPLGFYEEKRNRIIEKAFIFTLWNRVNFEFGDSKVVLMGASIPHGKLWDYNPLSNTWLFSSFQLSQKYIKEFVKKLNTIKPKFLHGYPSFLWMFASLIEENNMKLTFSPRAILSASENLYPYQRETLEKVFNCRVYSWLGLAEHVILAGECEKNDDLHIFSEYSYVELVDKYGNVITENGITGEIIGTNFYNYVTPFLRYKSGDLASYNNDIVCKCGRNYSRIRNVQGRIHDFVYNKNNEKFPIRPGQLNIHGKIWSKVRRLQVIQNQIGKLIIKIERNINFSENEIQSEILKLLKKRYHEAFDFEIVFTEKIERTKSGKHKFLIQNIKD